MLYVETVRLYVPPTLPPFRQEWWHQTSGGLWMPDWWKTSGMVWVWHESFPEIEGWEWLGYDHGDAVSYSSYSVVSTINPFNGMTLTKSTYDYFMKGIYHGS